MPTITVGIAMVMGHSSPSDIVGPTCLRSSCISGAKFDRAAEKTGA